MFGQELSSESEREAVEANLNVDCVGVKAGCRTETFSEETSHRDAIKEAFLSAVQTFWAESVQ